MAECKFCHSPALWVRNEKSRKMNLLEAEPAAEGEVFITTEKDENGVPIASHVSNSKKRNEMKAEGAIFYQSHFGRCQKQPQGPEKKRRDDIADLDAIAGGEE